jgi:hypothetical protein
MNGLVGEHQGVNHLAVMDDTKFHELRIEPLPSRHQI